MTKATVNRKLAALERELGDLPYNVDAVRRALNALDVAIQRASDKSLVDIAIMLDDREE